MNWMWKPGLLASQILQKETHFVNYDISWKPEGIS